jgi:outer membrane protein, heavy metal efflux system
MRLPLRIFWSGLSLWFIASPRLFLFAQSLETGSSARAEPQHQSSGQQPASEIPQSAGPIAQANDTSLQLQDFEQMALENNPTLAQAAAGVRAASGRRVQAGLYPNPTIGATGDENTPGPVIRGGEFGGFVEQRIVMAGKLGKSRRVFEQEERQAEAFLQAQKLRVLSDIRMRYYETLGAQQRVEVQTRLAELSREAVKISQELANVGAADQPDVLESEIEAERADIGLSMAKTALQRSWQELTAVAGNPSLQAVRLLGNLEETPRLKLEEVLAKLFGESPEIRGSEAAIAREEAALHRAKVEKIPDILARGGLRYNRELQEADGRPVGLEGFFDVGVEIPVFNRNQGNIATARANLEQAQRDADRLKLDLRMRMARAYKLYQDSLNQAEKYRSQMIPRAQRAYELYLNSFRQMAAAYPQVLIAQRNLFQVHDEYLTALVDTWRSAVEIEGLLLSGGLAMPGATSMDMAGRE